MLRVSSLDIASAVRSRGELLSVIIVFAVLLTLLWVIALQYGVSQRVDLTAVETAKVSPALPDTITFRDDVFVDAAHSQPFKQRLDNLDDTAMDQFILGRSFFSVPWVVAPSATTARDGLGPLFNANTCTSCHVDNGAGYTIADNGQPLRALVFKLAQPVVHHSKESDAMMNLADPIYGSQVAINGNGGVLPEATTKLEYLTKTFTFPDGTTQELTAFAPYLDNLNYGPLHPDTELALRQAPALVGMGLLAKVDADTILAYADPDDKDGDGISGRPNWVYDIAKDEMHLGKYGWKAGQPSVTQQTADAAAHDMGLTNPLFPEELCTTAQTDCLNAPRGRPSPFGTLDLPQQRLDAIAFYVTSFKAPQPRSLSDEAQMGKALFNQIGCTSCHRANLTTHDGIEFAAYSDLLLHDMGPMLADGRPESDASVREWRTAPLWGVGGRMRAGQRFLHDARAATPLEAILWHGGEAEGAKQRFAELDAQQRTAIIAFLASL